MIALVVMSFALFMWFVTWVVVLRRARGRALGEGFKSMSCGASGNIISQDISLLMLLCSLQSAFQKRGFNSMVGSKNSPGAFGSFVDYVSLFWEIARCEPGILCYHGMLRLLCADSKRGAGFAVDGDVTHVGLMMKGEQAKTDRFGFSTDFGLSNIEARKRPQRNAPDANSTQRVTSSSTVSGTPEITVGCLLSFHSAPKQTLVLSPGTRLRERVLSTQLAI